MKDLENGFKRVPSLIRHHSVAIILLAILLTACGPSLIGEAFRSRLEPLATQGPSSEGVIRREIHLPLSITVADQKTQNTFHWVADPSTGIRLNSIDSLDRESNQYFQHQLNAQPIDKMGESIHSFINLKFLNRAQDSHTHALQGTPQVFELSANGSAWYELLWSNVAISTGVAGQTALLNVRIWIEPIEEMAEIGLRTSVERAGEDSAQLAIDQVEIGPFCYQVAEPAFNAASDPYDRTFTYRTFVAHLGMFASQILGSNTSTRSFIAVGAKRTLEHPGSMLIQSLAPLVQMEEGLPSTRRIPTFSTDDAIGLSKYFSVQPHYDRQYPGICVSQTQRATFDGSRYSNSHLGSYRVRLGAIAGKRQSYWMDLGQNYRRQVESLGMQMPGSEAESERDPLAAGDAMITMTSKWASRHTGQSLYDYYFEGAKAIQKATGSWHHLTNQIWMNERQPGAGDVGPNLTTDSPVTNDAAPGYLQIIQDALAHGQMSVGHYLHIMKFGNTTGWNTTPEMMLHLADGSKRADDFLDVNVDAAIGFYKNEYIRQNVQQTQAGGFYLDAFVGPYNLDAYAPGGDESSPRNVRIHAEQEPKKQIIQGIREELRAHSPFENQFVVSEGFNEYAAKETSIVQPGYHVLTQFCQADIEGMLYAIADPAHKPELIGRISDVARQCEPIVQFVKSIYRGANLSLLSLTFSNGAMQGSRYHPAGGAAPGLTPEEYLNLQRYHYAYIFKRGIKPAFYFYSDSGSLQNSDFPFFVDQNGNIEVDRTVDPTGAGLKLASFTQAWMNIFKRHRDLFWYGNPEAPLAESPHQVTRVDNPYQVVPSKVDMSRSTVVNDAYPFAQPAVDPLEQPFQWGLLLSTPYQRPCVVESVFRSEDGQRLGVMLTRWHEPTTGAQSCSANYQFDPTQYGWSTQDRYRIRTQRYRGEQTFSQASQALSGSTGIFINRILPVTQSGVMISMNPGDVAVLEISKEN